MSIFATALVGAALSLAAETSAPAVSGPLVERRVETRDLDLFRAEGRLALDRRIRAAARMVCRGEQAGGLAHDARRRTECIRTAIAGANRQRDRLFAARGITVDYRTAERGR